MTTKDTDKVNWSDIYIALSQLYGWTPAEISKLTLPQVLAYMEGIKGSDNSSGEGTGQKIYVRSFKDLMKIHKQFQEQDKRQ